ncbi:EAL domain-containing protein [Martelella sp. FLE1502]
MNSRTTSPDTPYPMLEDEEGRLEALRQFQLMDTAPEENFDRLTALAARLFNVPIVLISLVGRDRQFFKSRIGLDVCETSRDVSFCAHALVQDDVLFIPDALNDPRFATNPLVLGHPFIRFYAGKPLITQSGHKLGTICLIDSKPRSAFTDEDRKLLADIAALIMDRFELRRLEYLRSVGQARFESIARTAPDAIIFTDSEGKVTFWNRAAEKIFGYAESEMLARSSELLVPDSWLSIFEAEMERLKTGAPLELADRIVELPGLRKDGTAFPAEFSLSTWHEGTEICAGAIVRDISERRHNEERLFRLASLDPLTDLPNRGAWRECLKKEISGGKPNTVLLMDLDRFKEVNDTLGHSAGDAVLKKVAQRLKRSCPEAVMIARLGGDEFVILLKGDDERAAFAAAEEIANAVAAPYDIAGLRADIGISIGIALAPQHSTSPEELLGAADLALYRAKKSGKGRCEIFVPALREVAVARRAFEKELKKAFLEREFELYYQPQFIADSMQLTGAEALIRWNHPERGLLGPASFIDVLGQKPSSSEIGEWILRTALAQTARWRRHAPHFRMSVNLFESQFRAGNLVQVVENALAHYALPAGALELEIVESTLLEDDPTTLGMLQNLRALGIGLAFDDYGTGFASLSLLKKYPVTRLKIDRTFIRDIDTDPEDEAVVRAVLYLGKVFGMNVIAEGVETQAQLELLKKYECPEVQGYLFGRPLPAAEFERRFIIQR